MYAEQQTANANAYALEAQAKANLKSKQQSAEADFFTNSKAAEAAAYRVQCEADAAMKRAEADYYTKVKTAEAELIRQQNEAKGLSAMAGAYAELSHAFGGPAGLIQYMMIKDGVYTNLAKANAEAIRGLAPKMTIWNTGAEAGSEGTAPSGQGGVNAIRNM
jgi:flotillin